MHSQCTLNLVVILRGQLLKPKLVTMLNNYQLPPDHKNKVVWNIWPQTSFKYLKQTLQLLGSYGEAQDPNKRRNEFHQSHKQLNTASKIFINHYSIEPWTAKKFSWKCTASDDQGDFKGEGKQNQKWEIISFSTDSLFLIALRNSSEWQPVTSRKMNSIKLTQLRNKLFQQQWIENKKKKNK